LDESALTEHGPWAKCTPPLRSREEVEGLWKLVLLGKLDFLASDHAPWEITEKEAGLTDIWRAPNGIQSLQFSSVLMLTHATRRGLALDEFVRLGSTNIAKWLGLYPRKGTLKSGSDADLAAYKAGVNHTLHNDELFNKQQWSPYEGMNTSYEVAATMVRGAWVYRDGEMLEPARGQYLHPR
jgi:dihydroorotase-like cyclic amidohydrolase